MANGLALGGSAGNLLRFRSSSAGSPAFPRLAAAGTQTIAFVDVADNHAPEPGRFLAPGPPSAYNSADSGGNSRWFLQPIQEIPTLSGAMLLLLATALAFAALRRLAR